MTDPRFTAAFRDQHYSVPEQLWSGDPNPALAGRVAPRGHLLIIGHHPSDLDTAMPRPQEPDLFYTADDLTADLPASHWTVLPRSPRARTATTPDGELVTIHDTVLHAQRTH